MKQIKLDENFPPSFTEIFKAQEIDASSVLAQSLSGKDDNVIFDVCREEKRTLVTFDLDFANILRYPATDTEGIIVFRVGKHVTLDDIRKACNDIALLIKTQELSGRLFVMDKNKIRMRKPEE